MTTKRSASAPWMSVVFVMAQVPSSSAGALTSLLATATVTATSLTRLVNVVAPVKQTPIQMASVTTKTIAWANSTLVACATVQVRSTSADVRTSPKETATVTATSLMPLVSAAVTVKRTPTAMVCATQTR